jgi:hypothetical protein
MFEAEMARTEAQLSRRGESLTFSEEGWGVYSSEGNNYFPGVCSTQVEPPMNHKHPR